MMYLYHWVPKDMKGDILYPLNVLKNEHPELYDIKASKYVGREKVMQQVIPALNCLWNDVLHFTAVHPSVVKEALINAGSKKDFDMSCYEIDPNLLDPEKTIVYLYEHDSVVDKMSIENFAKYDPNDIEKYSHLTQKTKDYYKEMFDQGKKPLVFHGVPHIFYKGNLNVKKLPIVKV